MEGEKFSVLTFACGCVMAHRCVNSLMSVFRVHKTHYILNANLLKLSIK